MTPPINQVETVLDLERELGQRWLGIRAAKEKTAALRQQLAELVEQYDDLNYSIIVTGSLGREEASASSDVDWLLLVDGPSNPDHVRIARAVDDAAIGANLKEPGSTGTFGEIIPSHDLVHYIAGIKDTNENLTRRMLLLAESHALTGSMVRARVIRNILGRYVETDRSVQEYHSIPHFLLNDVVRYWRTIASDYASKMWNRNRKGWATRNIKLRFSRKLLFVWGLLASFAGELFPSDGLTAAKDEHEDPDAYLSQLADHVRAMTDVTPLSLLARAASHEAVRDDVKRDIFGSYDRFLVIMADEMRREHLDGVPFEKASADDTYDELRTLSHAFRDGINALFFDQHPQLAELLRKYGVF